MEPDMTEAELEQWMQENKQALQLIWKQSLESNERYIPAEEFEKVLTGLNVIYRHGRSRRSHGGHEHSNPCPSR